jgi:hypothetical protein
MHEDKCVNKHWRILKMDYKRQTAVLSVMFILVGMMFLVSAMTEKAHARIVGNVRVEDVFFCRHAHPTPPCFTNIQGHMYQGKFVRSPTGLLSIHWETVGTSTIFGGGTERGYVSATVLNRYGGSFGPVTFHFYNPAKGTNTCSVDPPTIGKCTIAQGADATADYLVRVYPLPPTSPLLSPLTA